jgi:mono/diheme cytochrome c family protein
MFILAAALAGGCGQETATTSDADFGVTGGDMTALVNGCPSWVAPLTTPDGGAGGDTWATFAQRFFATNCTRCHSSTLVGDARNGAPDGYNWDDEAAVRAHLDFIRTAVGVGNFMPPNDPRPSCDDRRRIVRWIDAAAP